MWIIPLIVAGVVIVAAARSPRGGASTLRQLPAVTSSGCAPGPISVLGAHLRVGQAPPPMVILCAIAEAQALGRRDLVSDIVQVFVAPVIQAHSRVHGAYERGTCALTRSPRAQADAPSPSSCKRETCVESQDHTGEQVASKAALPPSGLATPFGVETMLTLLHTDPKAFVSMVTEDRRATTTVPGAVQVPPASLLTAASLVEQIQQLPGFVAAGTVLVDPAAGSEVFEVQWSRGHQIPQLPQAIDGLPLRVAIVETLPVPPSATEPVDQPSPPPGSPLRGVSDVAWHEFVARLAREAPSFCSSRHMGQFRQRRERLLELGVDPSTVQGSAVRQRAALDADLTDAYSHAVAGGILSKHLGRAIAVPGHEGTTLITLSGLLGVIQCAGLDGAVSWLETAGDRKRYPHTSQVFLRTNDVF